MTTTSISNQSNKEHCIVKHISSLVNNGMVVHTEIFENNILIKSNDIAMDPVIGSIEQLHLILRRALVMQKDIVLYEESSLII